MSAKSFRYVLQDGGSDNNFITKSGSKYVFTDELTKWMNSYFDTTLKLTNIMNKNLMVLWNKTATGDNNPYSKISKQDNHFGITIETNARCWAYFDLYVFKKALENINKPIINVQFPSDDSSQRFFKAYSTTGQHSETFKTLIKSTGKNDILLSLNLFTLMILQGEIDWTEMSNFFGIFLTEDTIYKYTLECFNSYETHVFEVEEDKLTLFIGDSVLKGKQIDSNRKLARRIDPNKTYKLGGMNLTDNEFDFYQMSIKKLTTEETQKHIFSKINNITQEQIDQVEYAITDEIRLDASPYQYDD